MSLRKNTYVVRVGRYKINDHLETGAGFAYFLLIHKS
jgi:hypothetical protein